MREVTPEPRFEDEGRLRCEVCGARHDDIRSGRRVQVVICVDIYGGASPISSRMCTGCFLARGEGHDNAD
jgi:hypothetical protein